MTDRDPLGEPFKELERSFTQTIDSDLFVIRIDGKGFSSYTRSLESPYDESLMTAMDMTAQALAEQIEGTLLGYTQSDEISIIAEVKGTPWFGGKVQKMVSVASSIATANFNINFEHPYGSLALFDARVHPLESFDQADQYLRWRRADCIRNSVNSVVHQFASHSELKGMGHKDRKMLIEENGVDIYEDISPGFHFGRVIRRMPYDYRASWEDKNGYHEIDVTRYRFEAMAAEYWLDEMSERESKARLERRAHVAA